MLALDVLAFGLAWWLGLYLAARDPRKPLLLRAGLGLLTYALALGCDILRGPAGGGLADALARARWALIFLPALCWSGALISLLPEEMPHRARLDAAWRYGLVPATALGLALAVSREAPGAGPAWGALAALVLLPLLGGLALVWRSRRAIRPAGPLGLLIAAALFFGLGSALLVLPLAWPPHPWPTLGIGVDLALLAVAIAQLDAFDEGETLRPDITRSFIGAALGALLFGGQVGLALLAAGVTMPLLTLLLATVGAAIAAQVLADPIQGAIDRVAFRSPGLREARAELRESASALPRVQPDAALAALDAAEFARLTRRALSHYGDLARLATSPLTRLPQIEARLAERGAPDRPIERAAELQALLAERIARLKPQGQGDFGTGDAWRYYNALFFPYVAGLRPYRRRGADGLESELLDPVARQALEWFATQVPERTLHNWQSAAARLIAQDLRAALRPEE